MTISVGVRGNPYVGPRAFESNEILYGRDQETEELFDLLIAERIVLFYSPSGAGKTSLIMAALIPKLLDEAFRVLPIVRVNPEPRSAIGQAEYAGNRYVLSALVSLEEGLPQDQRISEADLVGMDLVTYLDRRTRLMGGEDTEILIFDQFEEILTADPFNRLAKDRFFAQLGTVLRDRRRWALFSMREDYVAGLDPYLRLVPTQLATRYRLDLLMERGARQAIQEPARRLGVDFTNSAAEKLVNDLRRVHVQGLGDTMEEQLGPYIEPVQLQVVCLRLWEKLPPGATQVAESDIHDVGDVDRALGDYYAKRVEEIANALSVSVKERIIRDWFDQQLITPEGIRAQVLKAHERSEGPGDMAIRLLINAHLVREEKRRGLTWIELAHDRLVRPVRENNKAWREANLSLLNRRADLWTQDRPDGLLFHDKALVEAERWAIDHPDGLGAREHAFLEESRNAQVRLEKERRQNRLIRRLAVIALIVSVGAMIALFFAVQQSNRAKVQAAIAVQQSNRAKRQASIASVWKALSDAHGVWLQGDGDAAAFFSDVADQAIRINDPSLSNTVCWTGSIDGFPKNVFPACEDAVSAAPDYMKPYARDSRGLARALLGDYRGAIEDFSFFVEWSRGKGAYEEMRHKRETWIVRLKVRDNPFNSATLKAIRIERLKGE